MRKFDVYSKLHSVRGKEKKSVAGKLGGEAKNICCKVTFHGAEEETMALRSST